jgi:hypothetical protein
MKFLFTRNARSALQRRLRSTRPEPPSQLLDDLVRSLGTDRQGSSRRPARLGYSLAAALTVGLLLPLAAFGGLSSARSSVVDAASSAVHAMADVVQDPRSGGGQSQSEAVTPSQFIASIGTYQAGQWICHWIPGNSSTPAEYNAGRDNPQNWDAVQLTSIAVYIAHQGHTYDYGPAPDLHSPGQCKNNAPAV